MTGLLNGESTFQRKKEKIRSIIVTGTAGTESRFREKEPIPLQNQMTNQIDGTAGTESAHVPVVCGARGLEGVD